MSFFFKILKLGGLCEDKQYEQNNLGEKVPHNLRYLTCKISNFQLYNSMSLSIFDRFQQSWFQNLSSDVF